MTFGQLVTKCISVKGGQDNLAPALDLGRPDLSKRINGQVGWKEEEINKMLAIAEVEIADTRILKKKIQSLLSSLRIALENHGDNSGV